MLIRRYRSIVSLFLVAGCLIVASGAEAAQWRTCGGKKGKWQSSEASFEVAKRSFPSRTSRRYALDRARSGWQHYTPASFYKMYLNYMPLSEWKSGNGKNEVAFTNDYSWGSGTLAVAISRIADCSINEVDVMFNPRVPWNTATHPYPTSSTSSGVSLSLVALHEFGHALGLQHEDRMLATMNSLYPHSGPLGHFNDPDPHANDAWGNRSLYGQNGTRRDVAVSIYRRTGSGSSTVQRPASTMSRGRRYDLPLTISNRGNVKEDYVLVHIYASRDRIIGSASDTYLGAAAFWMDSGFEGTVNVTVNIPTTMATGQYYLGFSLDPQRAVPEWDEGNNTLAFTSITTIR